MGTRRLSLPEILVCAGIVVASAGIVVPALKVRRMDAQSEQLDKDLSRIAEGLRRFIDDTRTFPTGASGATTFHSLYTDGTRPRNNCLDSGPSIHLDSFLRKPDFGGENWKGPYLDETIGPDPWGNAYVVNVNGFFSSVERVMVISAGPNGQLNTSPSATTAQGDDIMVLVE